MAEIIGTHGHDFLTGTEDADTLRGWTGDDYLSSGGGADVLVGGDGDDYLWAGDGNDALFGGRDDDVLVGGAGADLLDGGPGDDDTAAYWDSQAGVTVDLRTGTPSGGTANGDTLTGIESVWGSPNNDHITGNGDNNWLSGGEGNDTLDGKFGDDYLWGGEGSDRLWGSTGNDRLHGHLGNDLLHGGGGDDTLWGGEGKDHLLGALGEDVFGFRQEDSTVGGYDVIHDFEIGRDQILLYDIVDGFEELDQQVVDGHLMLKAGDFQVVLADVGQMLGGGDLLIW